MSKKIRITKDFVPQTDAEIKLCLQSTWWRLNNLYWIINKEGDVVRFRPNFYQTLLYKTLHRRNLIVKVRQLGISTFMAMLMFDFALFHKHKTCGLVDKTNEDAKKKMDKISFAWDMLDFEEPGKEWLGKIGRDVKREVGTMRRDEWVPTKQNETTMKFGNGSEIWAGVSLRGGTIHLLHISELGITSHTDVSRAEEIKKGALNTVGQNCIIVSESTHEGGKIGVHWDLVSEARDHLDQNCLEPMQWRYHFFSWLLHPEYRARAGSCVFKQEELDYFERLERKGIVLDEEQKAWYAFKWREQKDAMQTEYPTYDEEAFQVPIAGSIYGDLVALARTVGKIRTFEVDAWAPILSFWDIGISKSDASSIWFVQFLEDDIRLIHNIEQTNSSLDYFWTQIKRLEKEMFGGKQVEHFYLPHDAWKRDPGSGLNYADHLHRKGVPWNSIHKVPKISDVWKGINATKGIFGRFVFHERLEESRHVGNKKDFPGALNCVESYRQEVELDGTIIKAIPVHDWTSHCADALRQIGQAYAEGLIFEHHTKQSHAKPKRKRHTTAICNVQGETGRNSDEAPWERFLPSH